MDFEDFRKDFIEEIKASAIANGLGSDASFVQEASFYLLNSDVFQDTISHAYFEGEGKHNRKLRVDGYIWDTTDNTMNLFIADYSNVDRNTLMTKTVAQGIFNKLINFVEEVYGERLSQNIEPSSAASDLVDELIENKNYIVKFRLIILSTKDPGERALKFDSMLISGIPVEFQIWDIQRIFKVCCSNLGRQNIEIDFKKYTLNGLPCIEATGMNENEFKSYLCIIPGDALANIYDDIGSQLLEGNVRSFLSTKVAVNKKIRTTILKEPSKFFAYNNGVSATAMNLQFEKTDNGLFITYAEDFQIINGGQTTASLSNAKRKDHADLSSIYVQMKLTEITSGTDQASELIRNISKSSNNQNKVSDVDFFSTHPFHIRMEQISRRVFAPAKNGVQFETHWFYERARGQYFQMQMKMSKSEKEAFLAQNPKSQLVTKTDFAKARNSWDCLPQYVSKGAQTNFQKFAEIIDDEWDKNPDVFNEKYFKDTMSIIQLFKELENLVTNQTWYEQGYRANIVTYSIALFVYILKEKVSNNIFDLQSIWIKQRVPQIVLNQFEKITLFVNESITSSDRETVNVTQWCKRDACWMKMKQKAIMTDNLIDLNAISQFLLSKDDNRIDNKFAKSVQRDISDAEAQTEVLNLGAQYWQQVELFTTSRKIGNTDMKKALWPAIRMPNKIPSPYQAKRLLELLELAKSEGFKFEK